MRLRTFSAMDFDPDGMSGGGVFVVQLINGQPRAFLAGIITRAGAGIIHMVKSPYIGEFLDRFLDLDAN